MRRRGLLFAAAAALSLLFAALVGGDEASESTATSPSTTTAATKSEGTSTQRASTEAKRESEPTERFGASYGAGDDRPRYVQAPAPEPLAQPSRHEADADQRGEVDAYVREKGRTDTDGLKEEHLPGGGVQVVLHDRFRNVPVATITEDGEVRIEH